MDADFTGAILRNANLIGLLLKEATLDYTTSFDGADLTRADLSGLTFVGGRFPGATFENASLSQSKFNGAAFNYASFVGANLSGSEFVLSELESVDFAGANVRNTLFDDLIWNTPKIWQGQSTPMKPSSCSAPARTA